MLLRPFGHTVQVVPQLLRNGRLRTIAAAAAMHGLAQDTGLNRGLLVLWLDQRTAHTLVALTIDINVEARMGTLVVRVRAIKNGLQRRQFGLAFGVNNLGFREFRQFVVAPTFFLCQVTAFRINRAKLFQPVRVGRKVALKMGFHPFPAFGLQGFNGLGQLRVEQFVQQRHIIEERLVLEKISGLAASGFVVPCLGDIDHATVRPPHAVRLEHLFDLVIAVALPANGLQDFHRDLLVIADSEGGGI